MQQVYEQIKWRTCQVVSQRASRSWWLSQTRSIDVHTGTASSFAGFNNSQASQFSFSSQSTSSRKWRRKASSICQSFSLFKLSTSPTYSRVLWGHTSRLSLGRRKRWSTAWHSCSCLMLESLSSTSYRFRWASLQWLRSIWSVSRDRWGRLPLFMCLKLAILRRLDF